MKKFTAVVHKGEPGEGGFWATCLEVPGATGQGETRAECLDSLASAIRELIEISRSEVASQDPDAEITELLVA